MKAGNDRTLKVWFNMLRDGFLYLPEFQRPLVWKPPMTDKFLESIAREKPLGVFWVLDTDSKDPAFPPRDIDGNLVEAPSCRHLLIGGQQRLVGLWNALHDKDKERVYYIEFGEEYESESVKVRDISRESKGNQRIIGSPKTQSRRRWFPCRLLDPEVDAREVDKWLAKADGGIDKARLEKAVAEMREIFQKSVIPYFALPAKTDKGVALETYKTINTNSVKLTAHYLAIAKMHGITGKSLYDIDAALEKEVAGIRGLETDQLGELILKISCVLQGRKPSGSHYENLDFHEVVRSRDRIFEGVAWAMKQLGSLNIWHGSQLPTVVPLRVLPGLHRYMPERGQALADANDVIEKYLWHAFLTDRYERQANDRLLDDYKELKSVLQGEMDAGEMKIFDKEEAKPPTLKKILEAGWPQGRNLLSRSILLVCCSGGANTLASDEALDADEYRGRDRHHIFPKSRLRRGVGKPSDLALNCMLVPARDNKEYGKDYPGDYIRKVCEGLGGMPDEKIRKRLGTHLIPELLVKLLMRVTEKGINAGGLVLEDEYEHFIEMRARAVQQEIRKILNGETE